MCEPDSSVPRGTIDALIDEVQAEHRANFKQPKPKRVPKEFRYQTRHRMPSKYEDCEYAEVGSNSVRKLTAEEIDEFRAAINRRLDRSLAVEPPLVRRSVV